MVVFLSSTHNDDKEQFVKRGKDINNHKLILYYNAYMGGIDMSDAMLTLYKCIRNRNNKHYIKQFRHLLDLTCLNSYIIYKKENSSCLRIDFMLKLIN